MLFNSMTFAVFFVTVLTVHFALPARWRWVFLLGASYYFYMSWNAAYAVLILLSTFVAYLCALGSPPDAPDRRRRILLTASIVINLGILFAFKYFNFLSRSFDKLCTFFGWPFSLPQIDIVLPVGISFYTFQALSYTIDVYRKQMQPERRFGIFALYVSFFPQLVAGPIERATHLLPQLDNFGPFRRAAAWDGMRLMFWGLFKKVVIADRLAIYTSAVFNNVGGHTGPTYVLATYFFAFQIYCDFSGYSDIAIGCARIFGIDLMQNFNRPYFATTITDFWRRWHISLSTWLRDYLYIPLGGNRYGALATYRNLLITMLLGGVWHGANWTFVIWGALQGGMLALSKLTLPLRDRINERLRVPHRISWLIRVFVTFHLVCLSWIFFRANTVQDAFYILRHLLDGWPHVFVHPLSMAHGIPAILVLLIIQILQVRRPILARLDGARLSVRWAMYLSLVFGIVLFGVDGGAQFIYFQF